MKAQTIWMLAADKKFNPATTGLSLVDAKPFGYGSPHARHNREAVAHRTRCLVVGCGVPYSPGGVCGYCRGFVKLIREGKGDRVPTKRAA